MDISVKVGVCLILLNNVDKAQKPLEQLWSLPIASYGDLYLDVADAYRQAAQPPAPPAAAKGGPAGVRGCEWVPPVETAAAVAARRALLVRAVQLYRQLVDEPSYDKDAVWLWQGHCLHELAKTAPMPDERRDYVDHAIDCFQRVRVNVPGNPEACNALNELYLEIGERDKLLETMKHGTSNRSGRARGSKVREKVPKDKAAKRKAVKSESGSQRSTGEHSEGTLSDFAAAC